MRGIGPFQYFEAGTIAEAAEMLAREGKGAYPLAGGTDLLVRMKRGDLKPRALVNLKRIAALEEIDRNAEGGLQVGALVKISGIEQSPLVRKGHPVLAEAAGVLGSPSIRNLGTVGGNIGRASPASDLAPSLFVLRAQVLVEGTAGKREIAVDRFFQGPGTTVLSSGEIITSFLLPAMEAGSGAAYERIGRREGMDCTLAGVAAYVVLSGKDNGVADARVALAAVAPVPMRAPSAEAVLRAGSLTEERMAEAAAAAAAACAPISDIRAGDSYRREMVRVLTCRALARAFRAAERGTG